MKKFALIFAVILLVCCLTMTLVACGENGKDGQNGKDGNNGENGLTPYIGENGNWFVGDKDTGVKASESGNSSSENFEYCLNVDKTGYLVRGIGTISDVDIVIPSTYKDLPVVGINDKAFENCFWLQSVSIGNSVTSIGNDAFAGCSGLISVTIGDCVTNIGSNAFCNCSGLRCVTIPDSVTSIYRRAFYQCYGLTSVTIGKCMTRIGDQAFYECYTLVEVWNKSSLTITKGFTANGYVGYYALNVYTEEGGSKLVTDENGFVIYDGTTLVGYVGNATEITIPNAIQTINKNAFRGRDKLTSVTFIDTTTWYRTTSSSNWQNKTDGIEIDVTNASTNATMFWFTYMDYYWYKL